LRIIPISFRSLQKLAQRQVDDHGRPLALDRPLVGIRKTTYFVLDLAGNGGSFKGMHPPNAEARSELL